MSYLSFTTKQEDEPWPERAEMEKTKGNSFEFIDMREAEWRRKQHLPSLPPPIGPDARV